MGRLPCRATFQLKGHDAMGQEPNGRKNCKANAQGAVRERQRVGLPE